MLDILSSLHNILCMGKLTLGEFLKRHREGNGFTLRAVEQETGISNAYLSQLESDKIRQPSPVNLYKLCELYRVSYTTAMELTGYPVPGGELLHNFPAQVRCGVWDGVVLFTCKRYHQIRRGVHIPVTKDVGRYLQGNVLRFRIATVLEIIAFRIRLK